MLVHSAVGVPTISALPCPPTVIVSVRVAAFVSVLVAFAKIVTAPVRVGEKSTVQLRVVALDVVRLAVNSLPSMSRIQTCSASRFVPIVNVILPPDATLVWLAFTLLITGVTGVTNGCESINVCVCVAAPGQLYVRLEPTSTVCGVQAASGKSITHVLEFVSCLSIVPRRKLPVARTLFTLSKLTQTS